MLLTTDCNEALRLVRDRGDEIDAVFCDYEMPQRNGVELLRDMAEIADLDLYIMSGYSQETVDTPELRALLSGFVAKPFTGDDFRRVLKTPESS